MITIRPLQNDDSEGEVCVDWNGREALLSWRLLPLESSSGFYYLAFQEQGNDNGGEFFVAAEYEPHGPMCGEARVMRPRDTAQETIYFVDGELGQVLEGHLRQGLYGRWVFLEAEALKHPKSRWVFLNATGSGFWSKRGGRECDDDEVVLFQAAGLAELGKLENLSLAAMRSWILQALEQPDSNLRFALNWLELSPFRQLELIYPIDNGDWDQLNSVLEGVLRWEIARQKAADEVCEWEWSISLLPDGADVLRRGDQRYSNARLRRWKKIVMDLYAFPCNDELVKTHGCVSAWLSHYTPAITVSVKSPSQHEVLEAHLFLRRWAEGKIEPKLVELLLPSAGASC